jgi:hypothetical protein
MSDLYTVEQPSGGPTQESAHNFFFKDGIDRPVAKIITSTIMGYNRHNQLLKQRWLKVEPDQATTIKNVQIAEDILLLASPEPEIYIEAGTKLQKYAQ